MMYKQDEQYNDVDRLLTRVSEVIQAEHDIHSETLASTRMTRKDENTIRKRELTARNSREIGFERFTKVVMDFAIVNQERFLSKLKRWFDGVDSDRDGVLNEAEFVQLLKNLRIIESDMDENLEIVLNKADPNNTKSFTFSECVTVFTETEVEVEEYREGHNRVTTINVIEKINKFNQ